MSIRRGDMPDVTSRKIEYPIIVLTTRYALIKSPIDRANDTGRRGARHRHDNALAPGAERSAGDESPYFTVVLLAKLKRTSAFHEYWITDV